MSNESEELGEGSSPAAWIAVVIMLVGVFIGTLALFLDVLPAVFIGAAIVPIGLIVGAVLARLGFGAHGNRGRTAPSQGARS
ncbi:HGxxPAAW family protein [uncultured Amnibacterium sp.]|uniref:HGxxPAAW family protein n=1 Tax=uncultured Amnibacterium sp. TaxID=1631851 RepID=UPI0035CA719A